MIKERSTEQGLFDGLVESLSDKHSQLDINFQNTCIKLIGFENPLEINGLVTLSSHIRDLTEEEKTASKEENLKRMEPQS